MTLNFEELSEQKRQFRQIYLKRRLEVTQEAYQEASMQLEGCYAPLTTRTKGKCIAGYLPMRGEIDITLLLKHFSLNGYNCCLPVVTAQDAPLSFRAWKHGDALEEGAYGIKIPVASAPEIIPDIIITPLIAYDTLGYRLGYGGGYYDRTLKSLREKKHPVTAIGAAFSVQQIKLLPREKQDERLDAVITEKGMVWF